MKPRFGPKILGMFLLCGTPFSPCQASQTAAFSWTVSAATGPAPNATSPTTTLKRKIPAIMKSVSFRRRPGQQTQKWGRPKPTPEGVERSFGLVEREGDDRVAALGVDLRVAARANHDILLAVDFVGGGRSIDACAG